VPAVAVKRREQVLLDTGCKTRVDGLISLRLKNSTKKGKTYNTIKLELLIKQQYFKCKSENFKYLRD